MENIPIRLNNAYSESNYSIINGGQINKSIDAYQGFN